MTKRKSIMDDPWDGMTANDLHIDWTDPDLASYIGPFAELRTSNDRADLEQMQRAIKAYHASNGLMRAALFEANEAIAHGDLLSARAAIKRGLGEDV